MSRKLFAQVFGARVVCVRVTLALVLCALALAIQPAPVAHAATVYWASAVSGNWTDPSKWDTGTVPGPGDHVIIHATGADYTITLKGSRTVNSVTLSSANATLLILGDSDGSATLTASSGLTNAGAITLTSYHGGYNSNLTVTGGTLTNQGTINVNYNAGGGRTITATLTNDGSGTVNINYGTTMNGAWTNNGTFTIASGVTLSASSGDEFTQSGGTLSAGSSTFSMASATFNFNGGTITGTPVLTNSTLNIGDGSTGAATFSMKGSCNLSGNIAAAQTVIVQGAWAVGNATLTATSGFTNAGTITLTSDHGGYSSSLTVTGGTLVNNGTINLNYDSGGGRTITATLTNDGEVNINQSTTMSGTWTNNGTFTIASGYTLSVSSGDVFNQSGGTLSTGSSTFSMSSATFNFNGGTITGTPVLINSTLNIGAGSTGAATFSMKGSCTLSGNIAEAQTIIVQGEINRNATLTAASGFTNAGTITLTSSHGSFSSNLSVTSGTLLNQGTLNVHVGPGGGRTISADLTNDGTVNINQSTTMNGNYTNNGLTVVAAGADLTVSGTLTNNGEMRETNSVTGSGTFLGTGGYGGVVLNAQGFDLGSTLVTIKGNQDCTAVPNDTVKRCFDIAPANTTSRNATITFYFANSEIPAGQSCSNLNGYRWTGSVWQLLTLDTEYGTNGRSCGSDPRSLRVKNVSTFSAFVLKETTPTAITLQSFSARTAAATLGGALLLALVTLAAGGLVVARRARRS